MFIFMSSSNRRTWRDDETLEAAARRLLQEWDERIAKKKAEEALQSSSKIQGSCVSLQEGERPEASALGFAQTSGRQHAAQGGTPCSDPVAEGSMASNGMGGGRATNSPVETGVLRTNGCARPDPEDAIGADRAKSNHAPGVHWSPIER